MASRRYSRIMEAARYYAAIDNYLQYIQDASRHSTNIGSGRARPPSQPLFIVPFAVDLAAGQMVPVSASQTAWNAHGARFAGRTVAVAPAAAENRIKIADFKAARVVITTGLSATGTVKTSRVTGLKYLSYGGQSTSIPFGRLNDADEEATAFAAIEAAITPTLGANSRVSLTPEKH